MIIRTTFAAMLVPLALAGCDAATMGFTGPVNANAVGSPVGSAEAFCDRPNEPTGQIVSLPGGGTTAVIDGGAGVGPVSGPDC